MALNGKTYITVASDASADQNKRAYGCAYYIRDDAGTHKHAWRYEFRENEGKPGSTSAELYALYGALQRIKSMNYPAGAKLIYYADNRTVLHVINDTLTPKTRKNYQGIIEYAKEVLAPFEVETRWVKSHLQGQEEKRYYLNAWCDQNARAMLRHGRLHIKRTKAMRTRDEYAERQLDKRRAKQQMARNRAKNLQKKSDKSIA